MQVRRDDDRLVRRRGSEGKGDRHVHAALAHVHGDGDRCERDDDERDDAPDGHELKLLPTGRALLPKFGEGPDLVDGSI